MIATGAALNGLKDRRPEWKPWLAVIEEVVRDAEIGRWDAAVPAFQLAPDRRAPLLADSTITMSVSVTRRLLERLIRTATRGGTAKMATLERLEPARLEVTALFKASICHEIDRVTEAAAAAGVDAEALQAVVALLALPFLQACNRQHAAGLSESWIEAYCPVCGSWPAFAEVRGIERTRHFRCGRCGGAWHAQALSCPYCSMSEHDQLVALVPEQGSSHAVIDACKRCLGYVKTFATLQGCAPGSVMLEDLASVDLDVAALEQGYMRPGGAGCPLDVRVIEAAEPRGFFPWSK
jgi:FdhE protein